MSKKKIVHLTNLSKKYRFKNLDDFYAGKWCGNPFERNKKNYLAYIQSNKKFSRNIKKSLIFLSKELNKYHKRNYSLKFWKIVLLPYVNIMSYIIYDRYCVINRLIKVKNIDSYLVVEESKNLLIFDDFFDFYNSLHNNFFNNVIFHHLLKFANVSNFKFFKTKENKKNPLNNDRVYLNKFKKYFSVLSNRQVVFYNSTLSFRTNFELYFKYFFFSDYEKLRVNSSLDLNFRNKNKNKKLNFQEILNFFLIKFIPKSYLESFDLIKNNRKNKFFKKASIFITSTSHLMDDYFKILYANIKRKKKNLRLIVLQYGCDYILKKESFANLSYELCDKQLNWGTFENKKKSVFIGANLNLRSNKEIEKNKNYKKFKILYVCNDYPLYNYKNISIKVGPDYYRHHLFQEKFLKEIHPTIREKIDIKPYFINYGWDLEKRIKNIDDKFSFLKEKNVKNLYSKYDLIISSTPTTTFLESVYLNIPSITLFDNKIWKLNSNAQNLFNKLKKHNIYFSDPFFAANYINLNFKTLKLNWYSSKCQKNLNIFRKNLIFKNNNNSKEISKLVEKLIK
jgi:putative transferase (TIGR04331 family)